MPPRSKAINHWATVLGLVIGAAVLADTSAPELQHWREPTTGMEFIALPAGTFWMGSPLDEPGREVFEGHHPVRLEHTTWMGRTEVTQSEWRQVMGANPSSFSGCDECPVEQVTWIEAEAFARRLGDRSRGSRFRLPTEAEWEYACRAGSTTAFASGATLSAVQANVDGRYPSAGTAASGWKARTVAVASYPPNAWGLFDLHGNVWEWTADDACPPPATETTDPLAHCTRRGAPAKKIIRGGSWAFDVDSARCGLRYTHRPQDRGYSLGLRLVREVTAPN
ncbi:MAG: formylglycine-generating enzyme family protein [Acidobacteriota bacterium]